MITKRKLNKKLNLLLQRQSLLATVIFKTHIRSYENQKAFEKRWNDLWYDIMGGSPKPDEDEEQDKGKGV